VQRNHQCSAYSTVAERRDGNVRVDAG